MRKMNVLILLIAILFSSNATISAQNKAIFLSDSIAWADSILVSLSDEQKIAQLFMVVAYSNKDEQHKKEITNLIEQYKVGGLMFLQGGPIRQAKLTNYFQDKSDSAL